MNLGDILRLVLVKGILSTQSSSYSTISDTSGIANNTLFTYSPYSRESRLLSSLFPPWSDYTSGRLYWSTPDYTPRRPYWPTSDYTSRKSYWSTHDYTSRRPYWSTYDYTSRKPYWSTYDYTSRRPNWSTYDYTSRRPYWSTYDYTSRPGFTSRRPYWSIPDYTSTFNYTSRFHYLSTPNFRTSYIPYISTESRNTRGTSQSELISVRSNTTTSLPITTTAKPSTAHPGISTTEIPPKQNEYKGINNFFAEKIIFIGNNVFTYNKPVKE